MGNNLREKREAKGFNQRELAEKLILPKAQSPNLRGEYVNRGQK